MAVGSSDHNSNLNTLNVSISPTNVSLTSFVTRLVFYNGTKARKCRYIGDFGGIFKTQYAILYIIYRNRSII